MSSPDKEREETLGPRNEVRDDEVVHRQRAGQQEPGEDPGPDQRQRHLQEGRLRVGEDIHCRLLDMAVVAGEAGAHRHYDEADVEHYVRDQDRDETEPERVAGVEEEREERGAMTISGVAIGRKMSRFVGPAPANW